MRKFISDNVTFKTFSGWDLSEWRKQQQLYWSIACPFIISFASGDHNLNIDAKLNACYAKLLCLSAEIRPFLTLHLLCSVVFVFILSFVVFVTYQWTNNLRSRHYKCFMLWHHYIYLHKHRVFMNLCSSNGFSRKQINWYMLYKRFIEWYQDFTQCSPGFVFLFLCKARMIFERLHFCYVKKLFFVLNSKFNFPKYPYWLNLSHEKKCHIVNGVIRWQNLFSN